jgi:hypothetical protein
VSPLPPRAKIEILKTNIARTAVGRYSAVISQHRRDACDTLRSATRASRGERCPVLRRSSRVQPVVSARLSSHGPLGWRPKLYLHSRSRTFPGTDYRPLQKTAARGERRARTSVIRGKAGRITYRAPRLTWSCSSRRNQAVKASSAPPNRRAHFYCFAEAE